MKSCKFGFHKWAYTDEDKGRWCKDCQKKQELNATGKWVDSHPIKIVIDETKFCQCPRDYTVSIRITKCPRCGLPRRPRELN